MFKPILTEILPKTVQVVDSAEATATALREALIKNHLSNQQVSQGVVQYLVTDSVKRFLQVGAVFLGESLEYAAIELVDICAYD